MSQIPVVQPLGRNEKECRTRQVIEKGADDIDALPKTIIERQQRLWPLRCAGCGKGIVVYEHEGLSRLLDVFVELNGGFAGVEVSNMGWRIVRNHVVHKRHTIPGKMADPERRRQTPPDTSPESLGHLDHSEDDRNRAPGQANAKTDQ